MSRLFRLMAAASALVFSGCVAMGPAGRHNFGQIYLFEFRRPLDGSVLDPDWWCETVGNPWVAVPLMLLGLGLGVCGYLRRPQ